MSVREPEPARARAGQQILGMDVARTPKRRRRYLQIGVGLAFAAMAVFGVTRFMRTTPAVSAGALMFDTVERGDLVREVRASGVLVPEQARSIAAVAPGRVEAVLVAPGATVSASDVLVELSNPDIELEVLQAEQQWTAAQAELLSRRRALGMERLALESSIASLEAEYDEAKRLAGMAQQLARDSLVTAHDSQTASDREHAVAARLGSERTRLSLLDDTSRREQALLEDQVQRLGAIYQYHVERRKSMRIEAGADGVVQNLDLQIGQWVQSGTTVASVARTDELIAELRIPQGQSGEVQRGQSAVIDAHPDVMRGRIRRVDPVVDEGHVLVEVELTEALPAGVRPNLNVTGTIQLERLSDVLFVDRPAYAGSNSRVRAFKCTRGGREAEPVTVTFGRGSMTQIEVLDGLAPGDVLILSDMSKYDGVPRLRIR